MAIVTITEAATLAGVSRGTLYNRLKEGVVSRSGEGIDTSELLRVFGPLKASEQVQAAHAAASQAEHQSATAQIPGQAC